MFRESLVTFGPRPRHAGTHGRWLQKAIERLFVWDERHRARRQLLDLDDRLLKDIGLTRGDALGEALKPFWRT